LWSNAFDAEVMQRRQVLRSNPKPDLTKLDNFKLHGLLLTIEKLENKITAEKLALKNLNF
jgi:hypothetical protein